MVHHAAFVQAVGDYAQALLTDYDIGTVLYRLTDHVTAVLGVHGAGVSLADASPELTFVAATDGTVAAIEEEQIARHEGPCHEAYGTGGLVAVADLEHDDRWPSYRPVAVQLGIHAVLGVPMPIGERRIGALNVYARERHDWSDEEIQIARALADMASGYVLNAGRLERARTLSQQLQHALGSRIDIEQAKGILAERHRITPADAFNRLRSHARSTNTRVHDLARRIVTETPDV